MVLPATQAELERRMASDGFDKTVAAAWLAEDAGMADANPYAQTLYRDYVQPLAALVQEAQDSKTPGKQQAHVTLLRGLDPWTVAFVAVRTTLNIVAKRDDPHVRMLVQNIGRAVHDELFLTQFDVSEPELYFTVVEDIKRRGGRSASYLTDMFRKQAAAKGFRFDAWGPGAVTQVGAWLFEGLSALGMVESAPARRRGVKYAPRDVRLTEEVESLMAKIVEQTALLRPATGPCLEPPIPWTGWSKGGWHTPYLRRVLPFWAKASAAQRDRLAERDAPIVRRCLNALQATAWQVNPDVLEAVEALRGERNWGEVVGLPLGDKPPCPEWLADVEPDARTPEQQAEFTEWKIVAREWHTQDKLQRASRHRFHSCLRMAREWRNREAFWFVYFCDSRGRVYPMTEALSPQGSDLQKGMLRFAEGKPLDTPEALGWFMILGANLWGFDKAPLHERAAWHTDKRDQLMSFADAPTECDGWMAADSPIQFLAWCFEYARYNREGAAFRSHLPVHLDGSCSGIQHYSAMLRDEVGGAAVNLTPSDTMQDIYARVAESAYLRLQAHNPKPAEADMHARWLAEGFNRKMAKRMTMTLPYGVSKRSALRYLVDDYLKLLPDMESVEAYGHGAFLMQFFWPAIGDVVVKAREGMAYLDEAARTIVSFAQAQSGVIHWETPSGFSASQSYLQPERHRVRCRLFGDSYLAVDSEGTTADKQRHSAGLAPNFIHSMDASHLHLVADAMVKEAERSEAGAPSLAFIHDAFGTHAADTQQLYLLLRKELVDMYSYCDPLQQLAKQYSLDTPPAKGKLVLEGILESYYCFS